MENIRLMSQLVRTTFTITERQVEWIEEQNEKTGLLKSEIVRRAIDEYAEREAAKEERKLFTAEQWREIREIARAKGKSALSVVRLAIDRERNRFFKRY